MMTLQACYELSICSGSLPDSCSLSVRPDVQTCFCLMFPRAFASSSCIRARSRKTWVADRTGIGSSTKHGPVHR